MKTKMEKNLFNIYWFVYLAKWLNAVRINYHYYYAFISFFTNFPFQHQQLSLFQIRRSKLMMEIVFWFNFSLRMSHFAWHWKKRTRKTTFGLKVKMIVQKSRFWVKLLSILLYFFFLFLDGGEFVEPSVDFAIIIILLMIILLCNRRHTMRNSDWIDSVA